MEKYKYTGPVMWINTGVCGLTLKEGDKVGAEVNINIATIYEIYDETGTTVLDDAKVYVAAKYLKDADDTDSHEVGGTHYQSSIEPWDFISGELELFARKYYDYDEDGTAIIEWLEIWDNEYLYRYKKDLGEKTVLQTVLNKIFSVSGYTLVSKKKHGFPFIPVSYCRNDEGPCWAPVQGNIEDYEEAFSYLCENNKAYAFPIFYVKGDGDDINIQGDMDGAVKAI